MPIHKVSSGYKWGSHGHVYPSREGAEKQAEAAYAHGYRGDKSRNDYNSYLPSEEPLKDDSQADCAGILLQKGNKFFLMHRTDWDEWEGPGGCIEPGEKSIDAACREFFEETGIQLDMGKPIDINYGNGIWYTLFHVRDDDFNLNEVKANHEHDEYGLFPADKIPESTHPQLKPVIESLSAKTRKDASPTEYEIIDKMRKGEIESPARFGPLWLFAMRVTGTGIAYRPQHQEWVYRPPEHYLNEDFLERIKGLPVLLMHAEDGPVRNDEYHERSIGVLVAPWIVDDEVWGIAKIFDDADAAMIVEQFPSTSPSVSFGPEDGEMVELPDGEHLFIEGKPLYIDHLAVVPEGVWDKYDGPTGINLDVLGERNDGRNATGAVAPYSWRR